MPRLSAFAAGVGLAAMCCLAAPARAEHESVAGPWGNLIDHVTPLKLDSDAARITHYRQQLMRALSGHLRSVEAVLRYQADAASSLPAHVLALHALSQNLKPAFAQTSPVPEGKPGARLVIWQEHDKFQQHLSGFAQAVKLMAALPDYNQQSGEQWRAAFTRVRHECLACHQTFRTFAPRR